MVKSIFFFNQFPFFQEINNRVNENLDPHHRTRPSGEFFFFLFSFLFFVSFVSDEEKGERGGRKVSRTLQGLKKKNKVVNFTHTKSGDIGKLGAFVENLN